jgi:hypothetical protein
MYRLRAFRHADWNALRAMHDGSFEIPQRMEETIVVADEETDEAVLILGTRITREAYCWVRHDWKTPQLRWRIFQEAHVDMIRGLKKKGVEDLHVWIKPSPKGGDSGFAKRLMKYLGWFAPKWKAYSTKVKE